MVNKICVIIVYFGSKPAYFPHFIAGCISNEHIDWLLITDIIEHHDISQNIHILNFHLDDFNELAGKKLGFPVKICNPYKLCDFKPAYGLIFEEYLEKYEYWGYCDMDLIIGKIEHYLPYEIIKNYDVISTYKGFLSGPFCLYRNTQTMRRLFSINSIYKSVYSNPEYQSFDENIQRPSIKGISLIKIFYFIIFIFSYLFNYKSHPFSLKEFRYQFQWFVKTITILKTSPADMTEIVLLGDRKKEIKVYKKELLYSDAYFRRMNRKNWRILWNNGILRDPERGQQIFGFHFLEVKNQSDFIVQELKTSMIITEKGIFSDQ